MGKYFLTFYIFDKILSVLFLPFYRTYQKELISSNELKNAGHDMVVSHLAAFERLIDYGGRTIIKDYAASCVTLMSPDRVPPGINYHVMYYICQTY